MNPKEIEMEDQTITNVTPPVTDLTQLALARLQLAHAKACKDDLLSVITESDNYKLALSDIGAAQAEIERLTPIIQARALSEWVATGAKKMDGVTVKSFTILTYDPVAALDWSRANLPEALTLDRTFFETHAKGVAATKPVPVVSISTETRAQIASNLSAFLPVETVLS